MEVSGGTPQKQPAARVSTGMRVAIGVITLLVLLACGLALYAFMLNVDLGDSKRRLSKEVETRQRTERYLVETRNRLNQSLLEIEQLKSQLEFKASDFLPKAGSKPALPIVVSFRSSFLGQGIVAVLENTSDRYLTVVMNIRNPTLASVRRFTLDIAPRSREDFGHMEGWRFASGDELTVFHNDFNALRLVVP